jgi:hypothetical protein
MDEETVNRREGLLSDARARWKPLADAEGLTIIDASDETITVNAQLYGRAVLISKLELHRIVQPSWPFQLAKQRIIEGGGFRP